MSKKTWSTHLHIPQSSKFHQSVLFILIIVLNFVLRIPSIPHEKGYDSFTIHALVNSISTYGDAQWWVNWLSVFGFYPYSYASGVPFVLSGMDQLMSIETELVILSYCIVTGIVSIFTAYTLAGRLSSNFTFKCMIALFFSIAPATMLFSTWEVSSRGLFIILLPLFIFLLVTNIILWKKLLLLFILFIFQFSIHHYGFTLVPIVILVLVLMLLEKTRYFNWIRLHSNQIVIFLLSALVILPFLNRSLIDSGSRYEWIIISGLSIIRQVGPVTLLAAGGFTYVLFKKDKSITDLLILALLTMFSPALYSHLYGSFILLLFIILFVGPSFVNITTISANKKSLSFFLILLIVVCTSFTGYFNHYRTGESSAYWYMGHDTYAAGIWGKNYIPDNSSGLDTAFETGRMFAISEGHPITPSVGAVNLAYGYINRSEIEYDKVSYLDKNFYMEGPYILKSGTSIEGRMEWLRQTAKSIKDLSGFSYIVQDKYYQKPFLVVVNANYNKIYENSRIVIWQYDF